MDMPTKCQKQTRDQERICEVFVCPLFVQHKHFQYVKHLCPIIVQNRRFQSLKRQYLSNTDTSIVETSVQFVVSD